MITILNCKKKNYKINLNKLLKKRERFNNNKDLIQKILYSKTSSFGRDMKPNSGTPQHHHNCLMDDNELIGSEVIK